MDECLTRDIYSGFVITDEQMVLALRDLDLSSSSY